MLAGTGPDMRIPALSWDSVASVGLLPGWRGGRGGRLAPADKRLAAAVCAEYALKVAGFDGTRGRKAPC